MIKFELGSRFSEVIGVEDIKKWKGNVIFEGGTATGKTYFVIHILAPYCKQNGKKMLFLCNRTALFKEVVKLVDQYGLNDVIEVRTYQSIERNALKDKAKLPSLEYDYVVCDEFHHINEIYNPYTDLSYEWILEYPAIKIFMSATCTHLFNKFVNDLTVFDNHRYYIPKDYSYVDELVLFNKKKQINNLIDNILKTTDDKIIFFSNSTGRAIDTHLKYKPYSSFICSEHSKEGKRFITEDCIQNETFNSRLLVATKALDVGVTLKDKSIKHIITDIFDCDSLVQCIGRKRIIDDTDTCKFYIMNHSAQSLRGQKRIINFDLEPLKMFVNNHDEFLMQYGNNREFHSKYIFPDGTYNKIAYRRLSTLMMDLNTMQGWGVSKNTANSKIYGKGYKYFLLDRLGDTINTITDMKEVEEGNKMNKLETYLESVTGKQLLKEDQQELKKVFKENGLVSRYMGINTLNGNLKDRKLSYMIVAKVSSRMEDGKKKNYRYWEVISDISMK